MALYGIVAGIHGNAEALGAVLAALERRGATHLLCLGDVVGYNADPDECAVLLRSRGAIAVAGRDDLIGTGRLGFQRCSNQAMHSLKRTRRMLSPQTAQWLQSLPLRLQLDEGIVLAHGGLRDLQQYLATAREIRQNAEFLRADFPAARLCFHGRSHDRKIYSVLGDEVAEVPFAERVALRRDRIYFIDPGSVDAQRKREHRLAECALFDTLDWSVEFLRLPYDAASTEAKAAVFGYRINRLGEKLYGVRRRLLLETDRRPKAERLSG